MPPVIAAVAAISLTSVLTSIAISVVGSFVIAALSQALGGGDQSKAAAGVQSQTTTDQATPGFLEGDLWPGPRRRRLGLYSHDRQSGHRPELGFDGRHRAGLSRVRCHRENLFRRRGSEAGRRRERSREVAQLCPHLEAPGHARPACRSAADPIGAMAPGPAPTVWPAAATSPLIWPTTKICFPRCR